jgi:hypothetical protein
MFYPETIFKQFLDAGFAYCDKFTVFFLVVRRYFASPQR